MMRRFWLVMIAILGVAFPRNARAVIFASTSDTNFNTTVPGGALTNSGWQYEGTWSSYLGTPIAPTFFVTAKHFGGSVGGLFFFQGLAYHTISMFPDPTSDLQIWQVAETFPMYAPLFTAVNETGKSCVVIGRGTQRGEPVVVAGETNGWRWGAGDGRQRWGENNVTNVVNEGGSIGELLQCAFDRAGNSNECHLSVGDSGGALFIQETGVWKLAGIHYAVDGYFSTNGMSATKFDAALLDMGGLYRGDNSSWEFITNTVTDIPSSFYSTRISTRLAWINSVINYEPGNDLKIVDINTVSTNVVITLATGAGKSYRVEYRDALTMGTWSVLTNNLPGTGSPLSVTNLGAASLPARFYRVGLVP